MPLQLVRDLPPEERLIKFCIFCRRDEDDELQFGKFYVNENVVAHYYCLLFSSGLEQSGKDSEGILGFLNHDIEKEVQRGRKLTCAGCKTNGATVGCCNKKCMKSYHYPCGVKHQMLNQYFGAFSSYCFKHRPTQIVNMKGYNVRRARAMQEKTMCTICHEEVEAYPNCDVLWAPCCKKQSWFHRICIQKLALSAGYFFKCPICSNNTEFCSEMKRCGIYVPEQDASWELEPNAFEDLVQRHNKCDAVNCICPKGRQHDGDGTRWELLLCSACGSKGIHIGCGRLHWSTMEWDCDDCNIELRQLAQKGSDPLRPNGTSTTSSTSTSGLNSGVPVKRPHPSEESTSSDSDSDVDVIVLSDNEAPPPVPRETSFSRNVARRGRGFASSGPNRRMQRHRSSRCNFDHLRFKVTSDDKIIVFTNKDQGGSPVSYIIPVDHPSSNLSSSSVQQTHRLYRAGKSS